MTRHAGSPGDPSPLAYGLPSRARAVARWLAVAVGAFALLGAADAIVGSAELFRFNSELHEDFAVPVVFSGALLLAAALAAFVVAFSHPRHHAGRWLAIGLAFVLMSTDELLAVHERIERSTGIDWQILYIPVAALVGAAWWACLAGLGKAAIERTLWVAGAAVWIAAQALEFATTRAFDDAGAGATVLSACEELLEMTGSSLFVVALIATAASAAAARRSPGLSKPLEGDPLRGSSAAGRTLDDRRGYGCAETGVTAAS